MKPNLKRSIKAALWLCCLAATACDVTYVVAPEVDAAKPPLPPTDAGTTAPVPTRDVQGAKVPCSEWGKGAPLIAPDRALTALTNVLWSGDTTALKDAFDAYEPVLTKGTTGDAYCVALQMLGRPRANEGVSAFYMRWLSLNNITPKDVAKYGTTTFDAEIKSTLTFAVDTTLTANNTFGRLFGTPREIKFAQGVPAPPPTSLPYQGLAGAGLLSDAAVLAAFSGSEAWPSQRGAAVRRAFLCEVLPPEPSRDVMFKPDAAIPFRQWHEKTMATGQCVGCHKLIDPIGYVLDVFDAVGQAHDIDRNGHKFDLSANLLLPSGETLPMASPAELSKILANSLDAKACYLQNWVSAFHAARGLQLAVDDDVLRARLNQEARTIHIKSDFALSDTIASAARLSFELVTSSP